MPTTRRQALIEMATNAVRNGDVKAALDEMRAYLGNGLTSDHEDLISFRLAPAAPDRGRDHQLSATCQLAGIDIGETR